MVQLLVLQDLVLNKPRVCDLKNGTYLDCLELGLVDASDIMHNSEFFNGYFLVRINSNRRVDDTRTPKPNNLPLPPPKYLAHLNDLKLDGFIPPAKDTTLLQLLPLRDLYALVVFVIIP